MLDVRLAYCVSNDSKTCQSPQDPIELFQYPHQQVPQGWWMVYVCGGGCIMMVSYIYIIIWYIYIIIYIKTGIYQTSIYIIYMLDNILINIKYAYTYAYILYIYINCQIIIIIQPKTQLSNTIVHEASPLEPASWSLHSSHQTSNLWPVSRRNAMPHRHPS